MRAYSVIYDTRVDFVYTSKRVINRRREKMKRNIWKRLIVVCCVISLFILLSMVSVIAEEYSVDEQSTQESLSDEPFVNEIDISEELDSPIEEQDHPIDTELIIEEDESDFSTYDDLIINNAESILQTEDNENEEVTGAGSIRVGDGVTANYDANKGSIVLYSNGGTLWTDWFWEIEHYRYLIKSFEVGKSSKTIYLPSDSFCMFSGLPLDKLDFNYFNTSKVTSMNYMFGGCNATKLDIGHFDTSKVTNMNEMFYGCHGITELDLSHFDTSKVTDMGAMFFNCDKLTKLDLRSFNTSKVTNTFAMFSRCENLKYLDLSSFDISNVTDYDNMLYCNSLEILKTPKKNSNPIPLPYTMYSSDGKKYNTLPISSKSIVLGKTQKIAQDYEGKDSLGAQTVHALVINGLHNDSAWGCDNDTALMYTRLCDNMLSDYSVSSNNVHTFSYNADSDPKKIDDINNWIDYSFKNADDNDLSFFYYSGHGTWNGRDSAAEYGLTLGDSYYRWGNLAKYLSEHVRGKIVVIMDACFSNNFISVGLNTLSAAEKKRFTVIASCGDLEESSNKNPCVLKRIHRVYYGCFTYHLGDGIGFFDNKLKADTNGDKKITVQELYNYTRQKVYSDTVNSENPMNVNYFSETPNMVLFEYNSNKTTIANANVSGVSVSYGYTGKEIKPNISVTVNGDNLSQGTDYTVKYENNKKPGTARITISGKGKYTGTRITAFEIVDCVSTIVSGKTYQLIPKNNSITAVCSFSGKMTKNTKVYITDRSKSEAMKFIAVKNSDGTWKFINAKCELALAIQQNSTEVGKGLVLYDQSTKKAQNWKLSKKSDNSFAIMNAVTGYSIAMSDSSAVKGTTLSMAKTESSGLQRFYFAETSTVNASFDGTYTIRASKDKNYSLNAAYKTEGSNINLYTYSNDTTKKFKIMYSGGGYYRLENLNSGLVLTVKGNVNTDGANVVQSAWSASKGQRWKIKKNINGTVTFTNEIGTVLHLTSNKIANGTNVIAKKASSTNAQKWYLQ